MQVVIKQYQNIASVLREVKSAILLSRPKKNLYLKQSLWVKNAEYFFFFPKMILLIREKQQGEGKEVDKKKKKCEKANAFAADWFYFWLWRRDHLLSSLTQSRWIQNILALVFIVLKSVDDPVRCCFNQKGYHFLSSRYLTYLAS